MRMRCRQMSERHMIALWMRLPPLHSGARLAAKLNAKIIVNGNEFNNAGRNVSGRSTFVSRSARGALPARHCDIRDWARETNGEKRSPIMGAVKKRLSQAARVLRLKR